MKTAVINFKADPKIKALAQKRAKKLGISLSMIMNDRLRDFAEGKAVFIELPGEVTTPSTEKLIEESMASGTSGPFKTVQAFEEHLNSL